MGNIHVLSEEVARHIAAGEVVDRPHSILRELLDNAIDADSCNVQVEITKGGIEMIRVRDDGHGTDSHRACREYWIQESAISEKRSHEPVSYTHLTLPTNREV